MLLLDIIVYILAGLVLPVTVYLAILTLASFRFKKKSAPLAPKKSIAVVIPAHNEENGIADTIRAVKKMPYPADKYEIFVIADNCSDKTAENAAKEGAKVFERTNALSRGKGQALNWLFTTQASMLSDYDAVSVIDADTRPHPDFLAEMSASLCFPGVGVVQGFSGAANFSDNWRTALISAALNIFNHLRPAGRQSIGGSAGLRGNGMAFNWDLLSDIGWPAYSVVEDIEFTTRLLLKDIMVTYNPDANVFSEMATRGSQARSQRIRWEGGRMDMIKNWAWPLIRAFFRRPAIRYADALMELLTPPLSIVVIGQFLMALLAFLSNSPVLIYLALACLSVSAFYVVCGQIQRKAPFYVWLCLLASPFFILWKVPLYVGMALSDQSREWIRTRRNKEQDK